MVESIITPDSNTISLTIPEEMIGKEVKIIAYPILEEADAIEELAAELCNNEANIYIPQWQKDQVIEDQKKIEKDPSLLMDWNLVKEEILAKNK
jgi:hypothetical protein